MSLSLCSIYCDDPWSVMSYTLLNVWLTGLDNLPVAVLLLLYVRSFLCIIGVLLVFFKLCLRLILFFIHNFRKKTYKTFYTNYWSIIHYITIKRLHVITATPIYLLLGVKFLYTLCRKYLFYSTICIKGLQSQFIYICIWYTHIYTHKMYIYILTRIRVYVDLFRIFRYTIFKVLNLLPIYLLVS